MHLSPLAHALFRLVSSIHLPHELPALRAFYVGLSGLEEKAMPHGPSLAIVLSQRLARSARAIEHARELARLLREHPMPGRDLAAEWQAACAKISPESFPSLP